MIDFGVFLLEHQRAVTLLTLVIMGFTSFYIIYAAAMLPWGGPSTPESTFEWSVSEGDCFVFAATGIDSNDSVDVAYRMPQELIPVLNTNISARIISLPDVSIDSEEEFLAIAESIKVSCTFENDTALPSATEVTLNGLVSRFILPTGKWDFIDSLFPDAHNEASSNFIFDTYFSKLYDSYCHFEHCSMYVDSAQFSRADIYLSTGIPFVITMGAYHAGIDDGYHFELIMV